MRVLQIRLPEPDRAYELLRVFQPEDCTLTVHGDGTLHIFIRNTHYTIEPNEDMKLVTVSNTK